MRARWVSVLLVMSGCSLLVSLDGYEARDAGGVPVYSGVRCGAGTCNPKSELCCMPLRPEIDAGECDSAAQTCVGHDSIECASAVDCDHGKLPGSVCCYVHSGAELARCVAAADCTSGVLFCDDSIGAHCEAGHPCTPSSVFRGLSSCQ